MTSDGRLPPAERRGYTSVFNAIARIAREEGVLALWRVRILASRFPTHRPVCGLNPSIQGSTPTIARAMVVNAAQLATYSQAKQMILATGYVKDGIPCHFYASMISGLVSHTHIMCMLPRLTTGTTVGDHRGFYASRYCEDENPKYANHRREARVQRDHGRPRKGGEGRGLLLLMEGYVSRKHCISY